MKLEDMAPTAPIEHRLNHLLGVVYSAHRVGVWGISGTTRQVYFSSALYENETEKLFRLSQCAEYAFTTAQAFDIPFLMSDSIGLVWLGEYATLHDNTHLLVLIGPMFYASTSREYVENLLHRLVFEGSIITSEVESYRKILREVPIVPAQSVLSLAKIMHFSIYQKLLSPVDIQYQTETLQKESTPWEAGDRSWMDYELLHSQEELMLQCVREGNLNYKEILRGLNFSVLDLPLSGNPLLSERNKLASAAALFRRASIEGGLAPKIAIDLETKYLFRADKVSKITELRELNLQMMDDFIRHVHEAKTKSELSRPIQECCEFIATHLTEDLSVARLAKQVGYTEYYLTRKFQKEMGVRLAEYIKDARLEYAKVCLLSTQKSVEEISDLLQFNSRNYFTKTFREKTGKTPTEFRAQQEIKGQE